MQVKTGVATSVKQLQRMWAGAQLLFVESRIAVSVMGNFQHANRQIYVDSPVQVLAVRQTFAGKGFVMRLPNESGERMEERTWVPLGDFEYVIETR